MASATALHARASLAPRSNLRPLALACALACTAISAQAQQQSSESVQVAAARADRSTPVLRDVVISASRDEQDADSLPMTVDVIDAKQMEEEQIGDIRELAAKLPNVTVPRSPARFTLAGSPTGRDQNSGFNPLANIIANVSSIWMPRVKLPRLRFTGGLPGGVMIGFDDDRQ